MYICSKASSEGAGTTKTPGIKEGGIFPGLLPGLRLPGQRAKVRKRYYWKVGEVVKSVTLNSSGVAGWDRNEHEVLVLVWEKLR